MPRIFAVQLKDEPAERYEQWVNTSIYTHDYEDCVGWLGCELPEDGHSCEFAKLAEDGGVFCASSSEVNRLRDENAKLRELVRDYEHCTMHADCSRCEHNGKLSMHCPLSPCFPDSDELRKLGVEVN